MFYSKFVNSFVFKHPTCRNINRNIVSLAVCLIIFVFMRTTIASDDIHSSALWGNIKDVEILLQKGASTDSKTENGFTLLHLADDKLNIEILQLLINSGLDVNARDKNNNTPLHFAVKNNEYIVKFLISFEFYFYSLTTLCVLHILR